MECVELESREKSVRLCREGDALSIEVRKRFGWREVDRVDVSLDARYRMYAEAIATLARRVLEALKNEGVTDVALEAIKALPKLFPELFSGPRRVRVEAL